MNYTLGRVKNHADSETSLPANNLDPDAEWGPSRQDVRHRLQGTVNVPLMLGLRANVNVNAQSATPYTITTGRDDNGDGVSNDRPAGVGRNTARGTATFTTNLRVSRAFALGGQRTGGGFPGGRGGLVDRWSWRWRSDRGARPAAGRWCFSSARRSLHRVRAAVAVVAAAVAAEAIRVTRPSMRAT